MYDLKVIAGGVRQSERGQFPTTAADQVKPFLKDMDPSTEKYVKYKKELK